MKKATVSLPAGMRDFNAETLYKRNYIIQTIASYFKKYGFAPLETPAVENLETLTGKYGEEGDKLIFKILNNGLSRREDAPALKEAFDDLLAGKVNSDARLTERALRYDLTIPLARYVAMNRHTLTFPFKRYQIQRVWRADKPQKGRYREFTQCDADIIGDESLWNEIDLLHLYVDVFQHLQLKTKIQINHRGLLKALQKKCGLAESDNSVILLIDKIDKIGGVENALRQLSERLPAEAIDALGRYLRIQGEPDEQFAQIKEAIGDTPEVRHAEKELSFILNNMGSPMRSQVSLELKLARGLDYYTGCIMEVKSAEQSNVNSIGGGGRYGDLASLFGAERLPGAGISFGLDRIYDMMEEQGKFPDRLLQEERTKALFFHLGEEVAPYAYGKMRLLREKGIACEMYSSAAKMDKQFKYAERKGIPYVVIIGEKEMREERYALKRLSSGEQFSLDWEGLCNHLLS